MATSQSKSGPEGPGDTKAGERAAKAAEARRPAGYTGESGKPDSGDENRPETVEDSGGVGGDASVGTRVHADVVPAGGTPFDTTAGDVPDPRTGEDFQAAPNGLQGRSGFELLETPSPVVTVPRVDPERIPAEVTPGVMPNAGGSELLAAAQAKAPSLTQEYVDAYGLEDEVLAGIARGEIPPPPAIGPLHSADLYLTPGGWQQTPPGVPPENVGANAISR